MATEKTMKRNRPHTIYKNAAGKRIPGVTTVLGVLDKPALKHWANRIGLQGISMREYVDEKAGIGTLAHYLIQCHLEGVEPELDEYSKIEIDQAENAFLKFLDWQKVIGFEPTFCEMQLVSEALQVGGTCDAYGRINGDQVLIDLKTSGSGIWPEMKHQASAYGAILMENGYQLDRIYIVRVGRDDAEGFETALVDRWQKRLELFRHCRALYDLQKELK
jgi:hypothetical protein